METETRTRVNENGRVVIPAFYRKALGIKAGDEVILRMEDDELRITTMKRRIERAQRLVRKSKDWLRQISDGLHRALARTQVLDG